MAIANYILPLQNIPQTFAITLGGIVYTLTNKWNPAPEGGWLLDISDSNNNPIVTNIPLITGADCLAGLGYLGINGALVVYTDGNADAVPTLDNLGVDSNLYFQTEVADA